MFVHRKTILAGLLALCGATGATTGAAAKAPPPKPAHLVTEAMARSTALASAPGKVESSELEYEGGRWVYSFDIIDPAAKGTVHEVLVDAASGAVVSSQVEGPQEQKAEEGEHGEQGEHGDRAEH